MHPKSFALVYFGLFEKRVVDRKRQPMMAKIVDIIVENEFDESDENDEGEDDDG